MRSHLAKLSAGSLFLLAVTADAQAADVQIKNAWARATPGGAQTAAAYVTLRSAAGDRLTGASTPVAQKAELQ